jgi:chorismate mutase
MAEVVTTAEDQIEILRRERGILRAQLADAHKEIARLEGKCLRLIEERSRLSVMAEVGEKAEALIAAAIKASGEVETMARHDAVKKLKRLRKMGVLP